jgi:hypothetical protein
MTEGGEARVKSDRATLEVAAACSNTAAISAEGLWRLEASRYLRCRIRGAEPRRGLLTLLHSGSLLSQGGGG